MIYIFKKSSKSHASKKHLKKSKKNSEEFYQKLKDALYKSSKNIEHNNNIYKDSNATSNEHILILKNK